MDEHEWAACGDPRPMLEFLRPSGRASERKLRLFAVACCRDHWHYLSDERSRSSLEVTEQFAEAAKTVAELRAASMVAWQVFHATPISAPAACLPMA